MLGPWHAFSGFIEDILIWLGDFTGNGGLAIILFTVMIKTLLLPLTVKSVRSTAAMQELQPKIKEIQKKYGKDRQKVSQKTMELYSEYGVNPAGGCLPMVIQMPFFFALYFAVRSLSGSDEGPFSEPFLWITDLGSPDRVDLLIVTIVPLAIIAGIFQFVQMRMMRPANQGKVSDPQQALMQSMMNFMPLMVVIFGWGFASGVVLYWVMQSLYSVIQQWLINGWGAMKDWFPWLPELPEHRRLGGKRTLERKTVASGEPVQPRGFMGLMARYTQSLEAKTKERESARSARLASNSNDDDQHEPDIVLDSDVEIDENVVTVTASGGRSTRRGRNRRRRTNAVRGGSGQDENAAPEAKNDSR